MVKCKIPKMEDNKVVLAEAMEVEGEDVDLEEASFHGRMVTDHNANCVAKLVT